MQLQAIADYTGYYNCPGASIAFVHPGNGNLYCWASEKRTTDSKSQDLSIYRMVPGIPKWERIKRYTGGVDAQGLITPVAGLWIDRYGALIVTFACVPKNTPQTTTTGYVNVWDWIPDVDEPWSGGDVDALEQQIAGLQAENASLASRLAALEARAVGGLSDIEKEALSRLVTLCGLG